MPFLRQQASQFLGYDVPSVGEERFMESLRGEAVPLSAKYDISRQRLGRRKQASKIRGQALEREGEVAEAEQGIRGLEQQRRFEEQQRNEQLRAQQDLLNAKIAAEQGALDTQGIGLKQKLNVNPPMYRQGVVPTPVADVLGQVGGQGIKLGLGKIFR